MVYWAFAFHQLGTKWSVVTENLGSRAASILQWTIKIISALIVVYIVFFVFELRSDLDAYAMPRHLTEKQVRKLRESLSHFGPHDIIIKFRPSDSEATQYARQLQDVFNQGSWNAVLDPTTEKPDIQYYGIEIYEQGIKQRPRANITVPDMIQQAFVSADIRLAGSTATGSGAYRALLLIGPRPLRIVDEPLLMKFAHWLETVASRQ
jgi:hypothetical protein